MTITLPYPPTANLYWRVYRGRAVKSDAARRYQGETALMARAAGVRVLDGPVMVSVTAYRPRRQGDLDNLAKIFIDALRGTAYHDDNQVVELHMYRRDDKRNPRIVVTVAAAAIKPFSQNG